MVPLLIPVSKEKMAYPRTRVRRWAFVGIDMWSHEI